MKKYDVIIVGAGPFGSACASYLSRAGVDVLLLDKETFPRKKPGAVSYSNSVSVNVRWVRPE